jgi:hypothetical protein
MHMHSTVSTSCNRPHEEGLLVGGEARFAHGQRQSNFHAKHRNCGRRLCTADWSVHSRQRVCRVLRLVVCVLEYESD